MREIALRVRRRDVEGVLDRLLPLVPGGVREIERGRHVELRMRGADLPVVAELARATGRRQSQFAQREVSDDWRERRRADYEPDVIGGRLVVAPEWAPRSGSELEIILKEGSAFGGGTHPTTHKCLELLLDIPPLGSFADLGCGTGVLAILAARLGWDPVVAVDISPESVETTGANAAANGVNLQAELLDLLVQAPPETDALAANVTPAIHHSIAGALLDPLPRLGLMSGFHASEATGVGAAYAARGFRVTHEFGVDGWSVLMVERT
ncbi:MAG: 50S ribosomal protein L11 methyltransferase [Solirubrobacteraceae bacterium]